MNSEETRQSIIHKYDRTLTFYGLAAAIPWTFWFIVAYLSHRPEQPWVSRVLQQVLGMAGLFAPNIIAGVLIYRNPELVRDFKSRLFDLKRFNQIYTFLAVFLIFLAMVAGQLISVAFGHSWDQFRITGQPSFTSAIFSPWIILISAPILEEFAWHCYGTDTLRRKFNLFVTSMVFAIYWVLWHVPLSFINGYYHSNVVAEGSLYAANFVFSLFVFVIIMNWLYYRSGRNIIITILFHLSANISNEIFATHPDSKVIQTVLLLVFAIAILFLDRHLFFRKEWQEAKGVAGRELSR